MDGETQVELGEPMKTQRHGVVFKTEQWIWGGG